MPTRHKLLLLDDDQDLVELYREFLGRLPSKPDIHTATSGARAIALLESEPFSLLISDLNMPKMDGLQVLTIVKRKFPQLRTAVMTSVVDEQFRARAYSMGVDLFLEKPNSTQEINFFLDCIESLLEREDASAGFRGVQSKSLVDLIQLECLSQSSSTLKITHGQLEGRIYIVNGEIIDSCYLDLSGEKAFQKILSWRAGNFEILPPEPDRARTIFNSYQGLLLETTQALDEAAGAEGPGGTEISQAAAKNSALAELAAFSGVEFVLTLGSDREKFDSWGLENSEKIADWVRVNTRNLRELGEMLNAGQLQRVEGSGSQRYIVTASSKDRELCVGFHRSMSQDIMRETMKKIVAKWVS